MILNLSEESIETILHALRIARQAAAQDARNARAAGNTRLAEQYDQDAIEADTVSAIIAEHS